jgi:hypothetical protein
MREEQTALVGGSGDPVRSGNLAREYLQARILLALQETGAMLPLAFRGETALRFLFDLPGSPRTWTSLWNGRSGVVSISLPPVVAWRRD